MDKEAVEYRILRIEGSLRCIEKVVREIKYEVGRIREMVQDGS